MKLKNSLFLLIALVFMASSCTKKINIEDITGTWKVVEFNVKNSEVSPMIFTSAKYQALACVYKFSADKSWELKSNNFECINMKGKWSFDPNSKALKMTYDINPDISTEEYTIESLNSSKMKWTQKSKEIGDIEFELIKE